jgi:phage shock protein PspC (stress-responsive transcriptional regulator)
MSELVRPRSDRVLGGVCVAIANRFDMSAWVVRAAMIFGVVFFGLSFWLYLVLWLIIPGERP